MLIASRTMDTQRTGVKARRRQWRIALASVAPVPLRSLDAEAVLAGQTPNPDLFDTAARAAEHSVSPISDVRSSAAYRSAMVQNLTRQALEDVWDSLQAMGRSHSQ